MRIATPLVCALCLSFGIAAARAQEAAPGKISLGASASEGGVDAKAAAAAPAPESKEPAAEPASEAVERAAQDEIPWALLHRRYNTRDGSTGGLFLSDASSGEQGSLRLQLLLDTYSGGDFLYEGDEIEQNGQTLSVGWTALSFLELFGAVHNRGTSSAVPSDEGVHALGDVSLGFKAFGELSPIWGFGGGASFFVVNDVGGRETLLDATNITLATDLSLDLRGLEDPFPLIGRFELSYTIDNGAKVVDGIEDARYEALEDPIARADEVRHLVTRFERFGLGVNRVDRMTFGLGLETPFAAAEDFHLHPLLEWRFAIPVNRQGYDCAFFSSDAEAGSRDGADDSCLGEEGVAAWPMNLAVGLRVVPPVRGISLLLGVDFGLSGTSTFVREVAPTAPYAVLIALGYDYDARPLPPPAPAAEPPPPTGRVLGTVVESGTGVLVAGVAVQFVGRELDTHLTDASGRFTSPAFESGEVLVALTHEAYAPAQCLATIPAEGGDVELRCEVKSLAPLGRVEGRVVDLLGAAVAGARVVFEGATKAELRTDLEGGFVQEDLAPGAYAVRVESDAFLARVVRVSIGERETQTVLAALVPRSDVPSVEVRADQIRASGLAFEGDSTELGAVATVALAELADLLLRDPSIRRIRIQGDGGATQAAPRAISLKDRLVAAGVDEARIDASTVPAKRITITVERN